jgi:hypothetical protein
LPLIVRLCPERRQGERWRSFGLNLAPIIEPGAEGA